MRASARTLRAACGSLSRSAQFTLAAQVFDFALQAAAELLVRLGLGWPTRSRILEDIPAAASENVVQKTGV